MQEIYLLLCLIIVLFCSPFANEIEEFYSRNLTGFPMKMGHVSEMSGGDIWYKYPQTKIASFAQITNNIKYPNNVENGTCQTAEFCDTLYRKRDPPKFAAVHILEPVREVKNKKRVNFFNTN